MNRFPLSYEDPSLRASCPAELVRRVLRGSCRILGLRNVEISVSFVGEQRMREINKSYRGIDESTDVLSFASGDADAILPWPETEDGHRVMGDLVIAPGTLNNNAEYFSIPFTEELCRVLIHGCLHLNGEDHATNGPDEPMLKHQEELMNQLKGGLF